MSFLRGLNRLGAAPERKQYRPMTRVRGLTPGHAAPKEWNEEQGIRFGFKANSWTYRCISMTMELGSTMPLGVQTIERSTSSSSGRWRFQWDHPLSRLLAYWNADFDPAECVSREIGYLLSGGNALTGIFPNAERPMELRPESPVGVEYVPNGEGGISHYEAEDSAGRKRGPWMRDEVCHARLPSLLDDLWGMGRLQALARTIDTDNEAESLNKARLEGGGVPDGIFVDKTIRTEEQLERTQSDLDENWSQVAGPFVVGEGVEWIQLGMTHKDLEWLEGRRFSMRQIVTAFGYHPALWGEDSILANYGVAELAKYTGGVIPVMNILCNALTRGLVPAKDRGLVRIWYDTSGVPPLQMQAAERAEKLPDLVAAGVPYDEAKDLLGLELEDLPGGLGKIPLMLDRLTPVKEIVERQGIETGL